MAVNHVFWRINFFILLQAGRWMVMAPALWLKIQQRIPRGNFRTLSGNMLRLPGIFSLVLIVAGLHPGHGLADSMPVKVFSPGKVWRDTGGKPIHAHGSGVLFFHGVYYLYGENKDGPTKPGGCGARVDFTGIRCYSSIDLYNWRDEGIVLQPVLGDPTHDLHPTKVVERPKVAYNAKTGRFVMWMHIDDINYSTARAGVAVADSPAGPFRYIESIRPEGQDSRDQTLFVDDDGKAYRIYSSEGNKTTYISLLSDNYLKHTGYYVRVFENREMEAQTIFKHEGKYYLIASGCACWAPTSARLAVADSIWGPWKELGNPCEGNGSEKTFGAQGTFVLPVAGRKGAFIFMADQWNQHDLRDSRYAWLPIRFVDGKPGICWAGEWALSVFDRKARKVMQAGSPERFPDERSAAAMQSAGKTR